jgi:amino acid transporter
MGTNDTMWLIISIWLIISAISVFIQMRKYLIEKGGCPIYIFMISFVLGTILSATGILYVYRWLKRDIYNSKNE